MNTKELQDCFDNVLATAAFQRRRDTWYKTNDETIIIVNLQKSQWGGQYYVNLAVYLRPLGKARIPVEYQAHIRVRLGAIAGADADAIEEALDLEREVISTERRRKIIEQAIAIIAVPYLEQRSRLTRLRELHANGQLGPVLITKDARELLASAAPR